MINKIDVNHSAVGHTDNILTLKDKDNYLFLGFCVYSIVHRLCTQCILRQRFCPIPHYKEKVKSYPNCISLYFAHLYNIYDIAHETASMVAHFDLGVGCFYSSKQRFPTCSWWKITSELVNKLVRERQCGYLYWSNRIWY